MNAVVKEAVLLKLDLGCGKHTAPGFTGCDVRAFEGVEHVFNMGKDPWPFEDNSVGEARASHSVEHLAPQERIHFVNELWRVLTPKSGCLITVPHWASCRAYGDLTHQWPPVSEFWFYYLDKDWRAANAPHNDGYTCDFTWGGGYNFHEALKIRNVEYQQFAMQWYKEACQDLIATIVARK